MLAKEHPQTLAETIGLYGCLVFCYIFSCGIEPDEKKYISILCDAISSGVKVSGVAPDCTVESAELLIEWLTGRRVSVTKKICLSIDKIKERTPVNFVYYDEKNKRHNHWIVVENGEIVFNPLKSSNSVNLGKPESSRVIKLA